MVQEAIKSNDNFALIRRWRCLNASSVSLSKRSLASRLASTESIRELSRINGTAT
jgi:hypothetical protein